MNGELFNLNLGDLLASEVPTKISELEQSSVELERVAAYCEANYSQSPNNKEGAFNETKKFTIQSLASVAYQINFLSTALLRSLELETQKLVEKRCEIQNISQSVNIQKEKMARREIGKLTINKSITRQNKITYPTMEEKTPRYQRTAVDYSILDGIGHGRRINDQSHCPSVVLLNRTGSVVSGDSLNSTNNNNNNNPYDTQYSIFVKGGNQTLTRNSGRSIQDQYRVPQVIPSAITPPEISMHYAAHSQLQPQQNSRYSTMTNQSTRTQMMMTVPLQNDDYGTVIRGANINSLLQQQQHLLQPQQQIQHQHFGLMGSNNNQQQQQQPQNRLSMESIDGLPPPPFSIVHNEQMQQQQNHHHDDPLPPPPPPPPAFSAVENHHYNHNNEFNNNNNIGSSWIPNVYLEKARVVYGYEATRSDELTLNEEAIVYVLRKNEDGWYEGVLDGLTGLFPGNYVVPFSD